MSSVAPFRDRTPGARLTLLLLAAASAPVLLACSWRAEARQQFAAQFMCPKDRVEVEVQRGRAYVPGPPPAEVMHDPGRYAIWQHSMAQIAAKMADRTYYVARGCGHAETLYCFDANMSCAIEPLGHRPSDGELCYDANASCAIEPGEADSDLVDP
jgi:hypothetical protein